jgi:hypothetical protein
MKIQHSLSVIFKSNSNRLYLCFLINFVTNSSTLYNGVFHFNRAMIIYFFFIVIMIKYYQILNRKSNLVKLSSSWSFRSNVLFSNLLNINLDNKDRSHQINSIVATCEVF